MLLVIILGSILKSSAEEDVHFAWPPRLDSDSCRAEDCSERNGITFFKFIFLEMQFLRSVISGSRAMRVLPSIGPVAETHTVLAENSMFDFPDNTKSAIFGMGCFWGVERLFYNQKGIYSTQCKFIFEYIPFCKYQFKLVTLVV